MNELQAQYFSTEQLTLVVGVPTLVVTVFGRPGYWPINGWL